MSNPKYDTLVTKICVEMGFCGANVNGKALHVDDFIPSRGVVSADQFAEFVFAADGVNTQNDPEKWAGMRAAIEAAFVDIMGEQAVDAALLR